MFVNKGSEILCLRYVDVGGFDCIKEHLKVIDQKGYVWFGKIGNKPMASKLRRILREGDGYLLLKSPRKSHLCIFNSFSEESPENADYPEYYSSEILPDRQFSMWFRITSISDALGPTVLRNIILISSRSTIVETAQASMASHFYTVAKIDIEV